MNKFGGLIPCTKCPNMHPVGYVCAAAPQQKIITTEMQLTEAVDEIARLKAQMPQWVSVDERLPERDKNKQFDVMELLFCADGFVFQGEFHYGWMPIPWYVWQDKDGDDYNEQSVTHWMKLPAAPNEAAK